MKIRQLVVLSFLISLLIPIGADVQSSQNPEPVDNVIVMIGDGMGFQHLTAASYVEYGTPDGLFMQSPGFVNTSMTTYAANEERTDSAASATAIATGFKTDNGRLSVFPNGTEIPLTILEYAEQLNKSSGLVSTTRYNHATPAAFAVKYESRNEYTAIAQDMLTKQIEVIMGGGEITLPSKDFISEQGYQLVQDQLSLESSQSDKVLGVFGEEHIPYEQDMDYSTAVRLTDMVSHSLELLSQDTEGFFLMVEGGRIDHAGHARDLVRNVQETIQFDYAVKQLMDFVDDNPNSLLLVLSDHETGGLIFVNKGNLDSDLPTNYETPSQRRDRRVERANQLNSYIPTTGHTAQDVPLKAYGAHADALLDPSCQYSNANVFAIMKQAFDGILPDSCPEYIEGFNDPDINDTPDRFATSKDEPTTSDKQRATFYGVLILPVVVVQVSIRVLRKLYPSTNRIAN